MVRDSPQNTEFLTLRLGRFIQKSKAVLELALDATVRVHCRQVGLLQRLASGYPVHAPSQAVRPDFLAQLRTFQMLRWGQASADPDRAIHSLRWARMVHPDGLGLTPKGERILRKALDCVRRVENYLFAESRPRQIRAALKEEGPWQSSLIFLLAEMNLKILGDVENELQRRLSIGCAQVGWLTLVESAHPGALCLSEPSHTERKDRTGPTRGIFHDLCWGRHHSGTFFSPALLEMESLGLVRCTFWDKRWHVCLTARGRSRIRQASDCIHLVESRWFRATPGELPDIARELDGLLVTTGRLKANLNHFLTFPL
ncbi:hypothetical protein ABS71_07320 [bacterium SCN 62-11]|nr:hypothetical protein [Candidatus Eremiobacteraeota bacterium]ODT73370.1 MAG: hypothetical protein ABS71_07320 [bacterium SCN 62-11]